MSTLLQAARDEYSARYFDWCVRQIQLAAEHNFREVKSIVGHQAALLSDFIDTFGIKDAQKVCIARLKKLNERVLQLRGQRLEPDEIATADRLAAFSRTSESGFSCARIPRAIQARWNVLEEMGPESPLDSAEVRDIFETKLVGKLGRKPQTGGRGILQFQHNICDWVVFTNVDNREDTISYTHIISGLPEIGPNAGIIETSISYLAWLGLTGTEWNYVMRLDLEPIASRIVEFSEIFLSAAPELLSGIRNPMRVN